MYLSVCFFFWLFVFCCHFILLSFCLYFFAFKFPSASVSASVSSNSDGRGGEEEKTQLGLMQLTRWKNISYLFLIIIQFRLGYLFENGRQNKQTNKVDDVTASKILSTSRLPPYIHRWSPCTLQILGSDFLDSYLAGQQRNKQQRVYTKYQHIFIGN